ncbi:MAG: sigma-70 family RNA polymerase sigma factor [Clostridiales bacterium]|nr:sigma-70 family RNA polymerase sigma factor [Clostridiales bacterium]
MEDANIIDLYFARNERAISESEKKYRPYCASIAGNILRNREDEEECLSDTWYRAWNAIPPARPSRLSVFLGKITRNLAIDRYRKTKREKNSGGEYALCLDELSECIGEDSFIEEQIILKDLLQTFLRSLDKEEKDIFLLRYWYVMPVSKIAARYGISEGALKMRLLRTRKGFKEYMQKNA